MYQTVVLYLTNPSFSMQIASILSDLASLRVCVCYTTIPLLLELRQTKPFQQDHSAALALVSVHRPTRTSVTADGDRELSVKAMADLDMERAIDLVELHYGVKMKHMQGEDAKLMQARRDVDMVLEKLEGNT